MHVRVAIDMQFLIYKICYIQATYRQRLWWIVFLSVCLSSWSNYPEFLEDCCNPKSILQKLVQSLGPFVIWYIKYICEILIGFLVTLLQLLQVYWVVNIYIYIYITIHIYILWFYKIGCFGILPNIIANSCLLSWCRR